MTGFTISIGGQAVDVSGLNFTAVTNGTQLATELSKLAGLTAVYAADAEGTITITKDDAGAAVLSRKLTH